MKKVLCLVTLLLFLCSCSTKTKNITPITKGISFESEISFYNETYLCNVNIQKNGDTEILFSSPQELTGLKINYIGNNVTVNYDGIEYTSVIDDLPQYSTSNIIYKIFSNNYNEVLFEEDNYFVKCKQGDTEYKMYIGATGLPIEIKSPFFNAKIKNATIIAKWKRTAENCGSFSYKGFEEKFLKKFKKYTKSDAASFSVQAYNKSK